MIKLPSRPRDIHYPHVHNRCPPSPIVLDSSIDSLPAVTGDETVIYPKGDNSISLRDGQGSGLLRLDDPCLIKYLPDRIWGKYFKSKLAAIEELENELNLISNMDKAEWVTYRDSHCPNIRSKHGLILHIFHWQDIYKTQIANMLFTLENAN